MSPRVDNSGGDGVIRKVFRTGGVLLVDLPRSAFVVDQCAMPLFANVCPRTICRAFIRRTAVGYDYAETCPRLWAEEAYRKASHRRFEIRPLPTKAMPFGPISETAVNTGPPMNRQTYLRPPLRQILSAVVRPTAVFQANLFPSANSGNATSITSRSTKSTVAAPSSIFTFAPPFPDAHIPPNRPAATTAPSKGG